jgi:hypothetical protein
VRPHLLGDNEDLSAADYAKAAALIATIRGLHLQARAYIERERLDPDIFLPGNVWAKIVDSDRFFDWTWDLVNYVKTLAGFSGFNSMMWGRLDAAEGSELAIDPTRTADLYERYKSGQIPRTALPGVLEREFDLSNRIRRSAAALLAQYEALLEDVPDKYRVRLPKRGGEIGILYHDRIVNYDLVVFQSRMNALYGAGALQRLEDVIAARGYATYAEIGPGAAQFADALRNCFDGRLRVFLVDLPSIMAYGCAYLSCTAGPDAVHVVADGKAAIVERPFIYVANYLVPACEHVFPPFDLVHNANSLNEMTDRQVAYYMKWVRAHLAPQGSFHLSGAFKTLDYHRDVVAAAAQAFPEHHVYLEPVIGTVRVMDPQHMFCYPSEVMP